MDTLLHFDQTLQQLINQTGSNPLFDFLMPLLRNKLFWIPLYIGLIFFCYKKWAKNGIYFILFATLAVGTSDVVSSRIIKPSVQRLRPCREELFKENVRVLVHCGQGFSFPSSHASNHFALATFVMLGFRRIYERYTWLWLVWAASIAYAQVYVGVHYPVDAFGGMLLGGLLGFLFYKLFLMFEKNQKNKERPLV